MVAALIACSPVMAQSRIDKIVDEIEQKGWSLVPSKYIEFKNRDEQIDFDTKMKQLQSEMRDLLQQEENSKQQLKELFKSLGYGLE